MNKEQEDLIATGIWLLIKRSDKIRSSEKEVWMMDYDKLFGEEEKESTKIEDLEGYDKSLTPAQNFRKAIEDSNLVGETFEEEKA